MRYTSPGFLEDEFVNRLALNSCSASHEQRGDDVFHGMFQSIVLRYEILYRPYSGIAHGKLLLRLCYWVRG